MASYLITSWQREGGKVEIEELMLSNCGAGEDSQESLRLQGNQTSQSKKKYQS